MAVAMKNETTETTTTNGEVAYTTTNSLVLDVYSRIGAARNLDKNSIIDMFMKAVGEDALLSIKLLFHVRDVRGGMGERNTFRILIKHLANTKPELVKNNIAKISEYGRWDDLFELFDTQLENDALELISTQLILDMETDINGSISLLAKWLPSINTSSKKSVKMAEKIAKQLDLSHRQYRKILSALRSRLNVVEKKMSAREWDTIIYEIVGSRSHMIYSKAFNKHDSLRFSKYKAALAEGKTKINAVGIAPYELVHKSISKTGESEIIEAQWKALPQILSENALAIIDTSSSMTWFTVGPKTPVKGLEVAIAMGIYVAEKNKGPFKDVCMSFNTNPHIHVISGKTLSDKYFNMYRMPVGGSTNIEAAYNKILKIAVDNNVPKEDMIKTLFIFSDMQFNECTQNASKRNIDVAKSNFESAGYDFPKTIFWNLNGTLDTKPARDDDSGIILVSGFSAQLFQYVTKGTTPYENMIETLNSVRYSNIVV